VTDELPPGVAYGSDGRARCGWGTSKEYAEYHDEEWGFPVGQDEVLFEKLCLEGFQAGLSWLTILRKRTAFRQAFAQFDIDAVGAFNDDDIERLLANPGIVRHRGKIVSTINNARQAIALRQEFGSLAAYLWRWEPADLPASASPPPFTPESTALSKDLKRRGWTFVGPTTVYAFMQAMGLVNDHVEGCWRRPAAIQARADFPRPR
jgi:DNA-3-methyladenine glycosylase I